MTNPTTAVIRPRLTRRETDVLLTWLGCETKEQAARNLFVTPATVNTHIARIRGKYATAGRPAGTKIALLARAVNDGLCTLDQIAPE